MKNIMDLINIIDFRKLPRTCIIPCNVFNYRFNFDLVYTNDISKRRSLKAWILMEYLKPNTSESYRECQMYRGQRIFGIV